jgi:pimeloyl-ACP methyl ester carboxylesterase
MPPLFLGSAHKPLYAFHHPSATRSPNRLAALLLQGFGHEGSRAHRAHVRLAQGLAEAGVPALRIDLPGCGDSWGEQHEPLPEDWREAVDVGLDELFAASGLDRAAIVGHRLCAWLALDAACRRDDCARLALWEPVLDGERYAEMLEAEASPGGPPGTCWVHGYPWSSEQRDFLRREVRPAPVSSGTRLLVLASDPTSELAGDLGSLCKDGRHVERHAVPAGDARELLRVGELVLADDERRVITEFVTAR